MRHPLAIDAVHAVIVTYQPDLAALSAQLDRLRPQVGAIVIVDNASEEATRVPLRVAARALPAQLIENPSNRGVAAALNQGIAAAHLLGAGAVLLMDQDSLPAADMVPRLLEGLRGLREEGAQVAAVGPVAEDLRNGQAAPFVRVGLPLNHKIVAVAGERVRCDFLITSGCLIPMPVLDAVGAMDEALFIDNVDLDWSFRAMRAGYTLHGIGDARMGHSIGDALRALPFGASFVHSPRRLYYMMRNRILLYRRPATPRVWVAQDIPRALFKLLRFSLFVEPRGRNARAMLQGIGDGLRGRSGPKPDAEG